MSNTSDEKVVEKACRAAFSGRGSGSYYAKVFVCLAEPHRAYHTVRHVADMLRLLLQWQPDLPRPLLAATLFHDAVYDPRRSDNEAASAALFRDDARAAGLPEIETDEVTRLILLTVAHSPAPDDEDGVLLTCADLWVLGGTPDEYATYRDQVRQEYAFVPEDAWRTGRARVLRTFLERERIYPISTFAPPGTDEREAAARRNLATEITTLEVVSAD